MRVLLFALFFRRLKRDCPWLFDAAAALTAIAIAADEYAQLFPPDSLSPRLP